MPWFCGSTRKRHSKAKVGNISQSNDATTAVANGRPSFTVVLQDFNATVSDELSAHRGQVLEALFTDREWVYVRNIDGKCGYVPQSFCYALEAVNENAFQKNDDYSSLHRHRPVSLHLGIVPIGQGSQSSVGVNHIQEQVDGPSNSTPVMRQASLSTPDSALSQPSSNPSRLTHRRSLSNGSQRNAPSTVAVSTTPDGIFSQLSSPPLRPTHRRSLSSASQRNTTNTVAVSATPDRTLSQTNPPTRTHHRSLSSASQRNTTSIVAVSSATPDRTLTQTNPPRPAIHRSLSNGSQRNTTSTVAESATPDRTLAQTNPPRPAIHRSLSNGNQRNTISTVAESATPDRTLTQTNPPRPTIRRSLSNVSQRNTVSTVAKVPVDQTTSIDYENTPGQLIEGTSTTSRLHTRRQSCPAVANTIVRSESFFKYTPYSTRPQVVKRSVSMNESGARVRPQVSRSLSSREAVHSNYSEKLSTVGLSSDDRLDEATAATERHSSSGSPGCSRKNCDCSKRPAASNRRRNKLSRQYAVDYDSSDDVFLPVAGEKKPFGIFRCLEGRRPTFKGEIALRKNELVIVLDYGRGQWAWVMTSHHVEGLVPKKLLTRYDSDRGTGGVRQADATTQTELVVSGGIRQVASGASTETNTVRQRSTASTASVTTNTARQVSSASSASGGKSASTSPLNTLTTPATAQIEVAPSATEEGTWFSFEDTLERLTNQTSTPPANRRFPKSAPVTPVTPNDRQPRRLSDKTDKRKSFSTRALSDLTQRGTPALTAAKDYEPPENSSSCLALKKGDVLTPQSHMHYPKGWMWVWHSEQRRFGYVPNSSVIYTYPITRKNRRTATVEDEV